MNRESAVGWFKSSYSGGSGTECVEVAGIAGGIVVRDSKEPERGALAFGSGAWDGFVAAVRERRVEA
ncbi:DUF397 domain-containing protein [Streptomyces sp. SID3212]|uniref:DUF397 domain-containing protein n=1 Tax=Streptomyces sp. SID3212 TaxID=2690259 RepID=UPI001369586D|nr:DUF397 domain-containing protein [Streptomyces sp. SID3212]MYV57755.1 DUF397 domain-containing protein [Streptomyces sp. SID3212]